LESLRSSLLRPSTMPNCGAWLRELVEIKTRSFSNDCPFALSDLQLKQVWKFPNRSPTISLAFTLNTSPPICVTAAIATALVGDGDVHRAALLGAIKALVGA
jgi:hypothetical protein